MVSATSQSTFGTGRNETGTTVTMGVTGEVEYPGRIAGYERVIGGFDSLTVYVGRFGRQDIYAETESYKSSGKGAVADRKVQIGIYQPTGKKHYEAAIQHSSGRFNKRDDNAIIARADTEVEAAREAAGWMQAHPAPERATIYRPALGDHDRQPVALRQMENHVDRIRVGSVVEIDALPPVEVTAELDASELAVSSARDVFAAELPSGDTIHVCKDRIGLKDVLSYAGSLREYRARTVVSHLSVSNESNLRDEVDRGLYQWFKARQDETVIKQTDGHRFKVVEVEEVRDGFVNPHDDGGLAPDNRRAGTFVDDGEAGRWFENPVDIEPGTYRMTAIGVVESSDTYAADVVVSADEWTEAMPFGGTDDADAVSSGMSNPVAADRSGLTRDGTVGDITGVGDATVDKFWTTDVSELYHMGFPAPYIPAQYHEKAIADMYSLPTVPRWSDAARAVAGILGGMAYNEAGEEVGTAAAMISDQVDPEDMTVGWLGRNRLKDAYVPGWISDDGPAAVGAGRLSAPDIEAAVRDPYSLGDREPVTDIRHNPNNDELVGLTTADGEYVEVRRKPLRIMATVADVDLDALDSDTVQISAWTDVGKAGEGVVLLNNFRSPINAVIDTESVVEPEAAAEA